MIKANDDDRQLIIDLLASSFAENKSVNYIIRQDNIRQERIRSLMDYSFSVCSLFGGVWLSGDRKACALVLYPHLKKTTLKSVWLDMKLIFTAVGFGGIGKVMEREALVRSKQPKHPMAYLWFIGVNPLYQYSGIGSGLLADVIADAEGKGLQVCLETSTLENLPWYERFGFKVYDRLEIGYKLFFLNRESSK